MSGLQRVVGEPELLSTFTDPDFKQHGPLDLTFSGPSSHRR